VRWKARTDARTVYMVCSLCGCGTHSVRGAPWLLLALDSKIQDAPGRTKLQYGRTTLCVMSQILKHAAGSRSLVQETWLCWTTVIALRYQLTFARTMRLIWYCAQLALICRVNGAPFAVLWATSTQFFKIILLGSWSSFKLWSSFGTSGTEREVSTACR
jgi:hypothetical protein